MDRGRHFCVIIYSFLLVLDSFQLIIYGWMYVDVCYIVLLLGNKGYIFIMVVIHISTRFKIYPAVKTDE